MSKTDSRKLDAAGIRAALDVRAYHSLEECDFDDRTATKALHAWLETRLEGASDADRATWKANVEISLLEARASHLDERRHVAKAADRREVMASGGIVLTPAQEALAATLPAEAVATYLKERKQAQEREHVAELYSIGRPSRDYLLDASDEADDSTVKWLAEGLLPAAGRFLLSAQRKTGKTTMLLGLVRALLSPPGSHFLGSFAVTPLEAHERVVFLNYEVAATTFRRWMIDAGIDPTDPRFIRIHLAGKVNPLATRRSRDLFADRLPENVRLLICDPFANAFSSGTDEGRDESSAADVGPFLFGLDELMLAAGISALVMSTHAGWSADGRSRGSSKLEDWPDTVAHLTMSEQADPNATRYLDLRGREVEAFARRALEFDHATRTSTLTMRGPGKNPANADAQAREILDDVVALVSESGGGWSLSKFRETFRARHAGNSNERIARALELAHADARIERARDGQSDRLYLTGSVPEAMREKVYASTRPLDQAAVTLFSFENTKEQ
jgi:hypothetical protein